MIADSYASSFTAPKAGALPGCATPRPAEPLRFAPLRGQAPKGFRGKERRNTAGTGAESPELSPNRVAGLFPVSMLGQMQADLPHRTQALYDRIKAFPEAGRINGQWVMKPDAYLAMLDLRQLLEREILPALHAHRECGEFVRIPRLEESR